MSAGIKKQVARKKRLAQALRANLKKRKEKERQVLTTEEKAAKPVKN